MKFEDELLETLDLARINILYAPASFKFATWETLLEVCNGCGAAGSWFRPPKRMYGTLIVHACHIHDWMYHEGQSIEDKEEADRVFLNNLQRIISRETKWYKPKFLMRIRAKEYYLAVKYGGGEAFWVGKNV